MDNWERVVVEVEVKVLEMELETVEEVWALVHSAKIPLHPHTSSPWSELRGCC
jgi:hypothetical protein